MSREIKIGDFVRLRLDDEFKDYRIQNVSTNEIQVSSYPDVSDQIFLIHYDNDEWKFDKISEHTIEFIPEDKYDSEETGLMDLPDETLLQILLNLVGSPEHVFRSVGLVNKRLQALVKDPSIWKTLLNPTLTYGLSNDNIAQLAMNVIRQAKEVTRNLSIKKKKDLHYQQLIISTFLEKFPRPENFNEEK